jgi:hypothetical protein
MRLAKLLWLVPLAALAAVGAHFYSLYQLESRFEDFSRAVADIGVERGIDGVPTRSRVEERVSQLADAHGLELLGIEVALEELTGANEKRADAVTRMLAKRLGSSTDGSGGDPGAPPPSRRGLELAGTLLEIETTVRGEAWISTRERTIETSRVVGRRLR